MEAPLASQHSFLPPELPHGHCPFSPPLPPPPCLIFPSLQSVRSDCEKEHSIPVGLDEALSSWRVQALGNTVLMLVRSTFHFPAVFQFLSILLSSQLLLWANGPEIQSHFA